MVHNANACKVKRKGLRDFRWFFGQVSLVSRGASSILESFPRLAFTCQAYKLEGQKYFVGTHV